MPARKSSRWRSFSPVEKVWVTPGPIRPPFRSLTCWRMVTARRGHAVTLTTSQCWRELICAPRTVPTSGFRPRFFLTTAFPLLCPGIHAEVRFRWSQNQSMWELTIQNELSTLYDFEEDVTVKCTGCPKKFASLFFSTKINQNQLDMNNLGDF